MSKYGLVFLLFAMFAVSSFGQDNSELLRSAEKLLADNKPDEAAAVFDKILEVDAKNYDALVFLCNYHFLQGVNQRQNLEKNYKSIRIPTRMQTARFENALRALYDSRFKPAEEYLLKACLIHRNEYLDDVEKKITAFKERIGIKSSSSGKSAPVKK